MRIFNKLIAFVLLQAFVITMARADEGMWLPYYMNRIIGPMQGYGCKLTAEQIYSNNDKTVKNAVVQFANYCTGEIVSSKGLVFTNHHCGYESIAQLSSTQANYLDNGYWAKSLDQEIPVPGLTISVLQYMEDVTARVTAAKDKQEEIKKIVAEVESKSHYKAKVKSMFNGNEYFLMVSEVFKDIRFVGAPPSSIGKFGGDTDNWMWPRHTGDFAVFRIYTGADNKPADYATTNKPYSPKHHFPISLKGVQENDFAMIMGYPGSTTRYLTTWGVNNVVKADYPDKAKILNTRLDIMQKDMNADESVRLKLASDYASLANSAKYFEGVVRGIRNSTCLDEKARMQEGFQAWVNADAKRKEMYGNVLAGLEKVIKASEELTKYENYLNYGYYANTMTAYGLNIFEASILLNQNKPDMAAVNTSLEGAKAEMDTYFSTIVLATDQKIFAGMLQLADENLPEAYKAKTHTKKILAGLKAKMGSKAYDAYAQMVYSKSILTDKNRLQAFLNKPSAKVLQNDLGFAYIQDFIELYQRHGQKAQELATQETELNKLYLKGLREYMPEKFFYPDANFTLRLTYGRVRPYAPRDGMRYDWMTTHKGILEKEIPGDAEFDVDPKLKQLLVNKDFGQYGANGVLPINFVADLDITGGNSGSPVINGNGELIGIAFDGVWEGMVGDLYFDQRQNRTISVDIRYVLFCIDKLGGAQNLIDELTLVK